MFLRRISLALAIIAASVPATRAQSGNLWKSLAPFPGPIREAAIVAAQNKVYMFSGQGTGYVPLGLVFEYDPATNAWKGKKRMPLPSHHNAIVEYNGKIYLFGGFKLPDTGQFGWEPIDNSWEYNPNRTLGKRLTRLRSAEPPLQPW